MNPLAKVYVPGDSESARGVAHSVLGDPVRLPAPTGALVPAVPDAPLLANVEVWRSGAR